MRVAVADDLEVKVVGVRPRVSIVYSCCRDSARKEAVHGVGGDALGGMDSGGVAETGRGRARNRRGVGR